MFKSMALAGVVLSLLAPATPVSASTPTRRAITVELDGANGSGCPAGSTAVAPVESGDAFTVTYSQFKVWGGDYKNCQLAVKVHVPAGLSYAIYSVDNRGYAVLDDNAWGRIQMTSYFTGSPWTLVSNRTVYGPYDDFWQTSNTADSLNWAPCNSDRLLNVNNTIRVLGPGSSSMAMASSDVGVSTIFYLRWRNC